MSAEFIVFDDSRDDNTIQIAMEEAERAGFKPAYFRDAEKAVEAVGFFTCGVVTSPGYYSYLKNRYEGITLIQAADLLEIPKAIFDDDNAVSRVGDMMRPDRHDVLVPRQPHHNAEAILRSWISNLPRVA